ncbi:MAG: FliH/SctL family protein [Pseudomonadota bacterium]
MTSVRPMFSAQRMTKAVFNKKVRASKDRLDAECQASCILDDANTRAESLIKSAQFKAEAIIEKAKEDARLEAKSLIGRLERENNARVCTETLSLSNAIQTDFDDLKGWISQLVLTATEGIIGSFEKTEKIQRLLTTALQTTKQRWSLTLAVHPEDQTTVQQLIEQCSEQMSAITEVIGDGTLDQGEMILSGAGGLSKIGVRAQMSELRSALVGANEDMI